MSCAYSCGSRLLYFVPESYPEKTDDFSRFRREKIGCAGTTRPDAVAHDMVDGRLSLIRTSPLSHGLVFFAAVKTATAGIGKTSRHSSSRCLYKEPSRRTHPCRGPQRS